MIYRSSMQDEESVAARETEEELERLRAENRRLAESLGAFSAFVASRGLLEEAWHFVHNVYRMDREGGSTD